jgi:RNA polymerase sigma-70 factor (ECF subfamily)
MSLQSDDVVVIADGGGKALAACRPIAGSKNVAAYIIGISRMATQISGIESAMINGQPGFIFLEGERVDSVLALDIDRDRLKGIHIITNPDKLGWIGQQIGGLASRNGPADLTGGHPRAAHDGDAAQ